MSEIDERLAEIRERTNRYIFHEATDDALRQAEDDLHYLLDLVEQLRQVRGNWSPDYKRQVLYELEAAEAEAAELRERLAALEFAYGSLRASANILEQQLADVSALVPEADWLEMIAENGIDSTVAHQIYDLADRIRAWRGDGDGGEGEGENDGD